MSGPWAFLLFALVGAELLETSPVFTNSTGKRFQFIRSALNDRCLGYDYRQKENRIYEDVCRENWPMLWAAIRISDNIYKFENAETLDCMFAQQPTTTGTALVGFDCDGTLEGATSEFIVSNPLPGVFSLVPYLNSTDHTLCVESGTVESAPQMAEWPRVQDCNNGLSQKFVIGYDEDDKPTPPPPKTDTTPTPSPPTTTVTTVTVTRYASYPPPPPDIIVTTTTTVTAVMNTVRTSTSYIDCTTQEYTTLSEPTARSSTKPQALGREISDKLSNQSSGVSRRQGTKLPLLVRNSTMYVANFILLHCNSYGSRYPNKHCYCCSNRDTSCPD